VNGEKDAPDQHRAFSKAFLSPAFCRGEDR
jgi:hypothetical protein